MQLSKMWYVIAAALLTLSACKQGEPIKVDDYIVGSYEGAVGGPVACTEVHTYFTSIPPVHYGLAVCLHRMIGKAYIDVAALGRIQENVDLMCTDLGQCSYPQRVAQQYVHQAIDQALRAHADRFR